MIGLIAGLILPGVAQAMRPYLPELIALLLLLAAYRIGPQTAIGNLGNKEGLPAIPFRTDEW